MKSVGLRRYWHTVRYLRPVQLFGRLWFRFYKPGVVDRPAPPPRCPERSWSACGRWPRQTGPTSFNFIGQAKKISSPGDWNRTDWPKLWLYNLHYFDDLLANGSDQRLDWHRLLIARWLSENPPAKGIGWEPYPTSLRLVNWCKWLLAGNEPVGGMLDSMAIQTRFLGKRLERHLLGNHLWANLKALMFGGIYFRGNEADGWRLRGLRMFRRELQEQILPDGGHFERSPMYQAVLLEDLLDLIQLDLIFPGVFPKDDVAVWRETSTRMLYWLEAMTHPDGDISFFNDAAFGIAPQIDTLLAYSSSVGLGSGPRLHNEVTNLDSSGYLRLERGSAVALIDAAAIGPDYLPGHAHADTLSFELSIGDSRVLVNGGTSTYESNAQRRYERGTAMHNTVMVDGLDSSEVWGAFRVARRARVRAGSVREFDGEVEFYASHDGYRRLGGGVMHHRAWRMNVNRLVVEDSLDGTFNEATARFRFGPDIDIRQFQESQGRASGPGFKLFWDCEGGRAEIEEGEWHPRFGESIPCKVLIVYFRSNRISTSFEWQKECRE